MFGASGGVRGISLSESGGITAEELKQLTTLDFFGEILSRMKMMTTIEAYGGLGNKMGAKILKNVAVNPAVFKYNDLHVNMFNTHTGDIGVGLAELVDDRNVNGGIHEIIKHIPAEYKKRIHIFLLGLTPERAKALYKAMAVIMNADQFPDEVVAEADRLLDQIANELNGSGGRMDVGLKLAERSKELVKMFTGLFQPDFRIGVGSMGGGGTATAFFPFHAELMYQVTPNSIVIDNAIMPFADEGSEKFEQFKKSSEMTKPFVNLLIFHNPQKYVGRRISFSELEQRLVEKPTAFVSALTRVVTPTKDVKMLLDKADIKSAFGNKGENVGDIVYVDNRMDNGGYMDVVKMAQEKVELSVKPDVLLVIFEIPKNHPNVYRGRDFTGAGLQEITIDDVIEATEIIKSGANVKRVLRGVYEVEREKPIINAYVVATKRIKDKGETGENSKLNDFFDDLEL